MRDYVGTLSRFYSRTYAGLLKVQFDTEQLASRLEKIAAAFEAGEEVRVDFATDKRMAEALELYRKGPAQHERLGQVLTHASDREIRNVLDFGCRDGATLRVLARSLYRANLVGVDPLVRSTVSEFLNGTWINLVRDVHEATDLAKTYDLILALFTLHHLPRAEFDPSARSLAKLLSRSGLLFVLEDEPRFEGTCQSAFDEEFRRLTLSDRLLLLRVNDYWSNVIIYGQSAIDQHHNFEPAAEWEVLFQSAGLVLVGRRTYGFNVRRLHGVPASELIFASAAAIRRQ